MDGSFGNSNQDSRSRDIDNPRNKLINELMSEMQKGTNMPHNGSTPIMASGSYPDANMGGVPRDAFAAPNQQFGGNPGMQMPMPMPMPMPMQGMQPMNPMMMQQMPSMDQARAGNPIMGNLDMTEEAQCEDEEGMEQQYQEEYEDDDGDSGEDTEKEETQVSTVDSILEASKEPLAGAIILMLLLTPQFNGLFNQLLPRVSENLIYSLLFKGLIFFVIFYLIQKYL
jgi:hypothetical protein